MSYFENMTPQENAFFETMKTAPESTRDHFRSMMNYLMSCYDASGNKGVLVVLTPDPEKNAGTLLVAGMRVDSGEQVQALLALAIDSENNPHTATQDSVQ